MLVARGVVKPIPHGQVVIFALTLAALFRWYRSTRDSRNFQYKIRCRYVLLLYYMDEHERLSDMFGILLVFKMKISLLSTTQESNLGSLSPDSPKTGTKTRRPKFQFS